MEENRKAINDLSVRVDELEKALNAIINKENHTGDKQENNDERKQYRQKVFLVYKQHCIAKDLFKTKKYDEALKIYENIINSTYNESKTSTYESLATCYLELKKFEQAGDNYINFINHILNNKIQLLIHSISEYLFYAAICFLICKNEQKYQKILSDTRLSDKHKNQLLSCNFHTHNDLRLQYLVSNL